MKAARTVLLTIIWIAAVQTLAGAQSRLVWDTVVSGALRGNPLGDSPARSVIVYLPPGYHDSARRFPVVYLLHGNRSHNTKFVSGSYNGFRLQADMDSLIRVGAARDFILVVPDAYNRYGGSHYTNSAVTGNWADFIVNDLVRHVDAKYRTLPHPRSRGLAGYSMGGRGVLELAMRQPGVFSAVYALSPGRLAFERYGIFPDDDWRATIALRKQPLPDVQTTRVLSYAAAFSPNPRRPPFYVDLPYRMVGARLVKVPEVWRRWVANDPVAMVATHAVALRQLKGLRIDCGKSDELIEANRLLSRTLRQHGVPHTFEEYEGNHTSAIGNRLRQRVLPFFSQVLSFN